MIRELPRCGHLCGASYVRDPDGVKKGIALLEYNSSDSVASEIWHMRGMLLLRMGYERDVRRGAARAIYVRRPACAEIWGGRARARV